MRIGPLLALCVLGACAARPTATIPLASESHPPAPVGGEEDSPSRQHEVSPAPAGLREVFPHVRVDVARRLVELDAVVPIDAHDPQTPHVYLEVIACTPDTREHETLVMTRARPAHVHAALLAIGLRPGHPGSWRVGGETLLIEPPMGDAVDVSFVTRAGNGTEREEPASTWIIHAGSRRPILPPASPTPFVFAGSRFVRRGGQEVYDADGTGQIIGLATFGSEVVAWREVICPEATLTPPEWIADASVIPSRGTPVVVRLRPGAAPAPSPQP